VFFSDLARRLFLGWLGEALPALGCALHAYVLMTNHVHLLQTAERPGAPPRLMQSLGRRYVGYVNRVHRRSDTSWEGRYKSTIVDNDGRVLAC
jgi:putative transposase